MHELSITQSMLDLVLEEAKKVNTQKVQRINLTVGEMSGIVDECVEFYFGFLSQDTIASEAALVFRKVSTEARCRSCGQVFTPKPFDWACPRCQNQGIEIIAGKELYVESIEVE